MPYRYHDGALEVFLVHPGGPFWAKKDEGAWSIAKGEYAEGEEPIEAARREFQEETGFALEGALIPLGWTKLAGGKTVHGWAVEAELEPGAIESNLFEMEWPPRSGKRAQFPEVDRAAWFSVAEAREKLNVGLIPLLDALVAVAGGDKP